MVSLVSVVAVLVCCSSLGRSAPQPLGAEIIPVCTAFDSLCDVAMDVTDTTPLNSQPMCACPHASQPCPAPGTVDPSRTVQLYQTSETGRPVVLRLSYCNPRSNLQRDCKRGELALTVQGFGPIMFQDVGRMKCRCSEPLSLKRSRPLGYFFREQEYVCGQDTCDVNRTKEPVCEQVVGNMASLLKSEFVCACPEGFRCSAGSNSKQMTCKAL